MSPARLPFRFSDLDAETQAAFVAWDHDNIGNSAVSLDMVRDGWETGDPVATDFVGYFANYLEHLAMLMYARSPLVTA